MNCDYFAVKEPLSLKEHNLYNRFQITLVLTLKDPHCEYQSDLSNLVHLTFKRADECGCVLDTLKVNKKKDQLFILLFS